MKSDNISDVRIWKCLNVTRKQHALQPVKWVCQRLINDAQQHAAIWRRMHHTKHTLSQHDDLPYDVPTISNQSTHYFWFCLTGPFFGDNSRQAGSHKGSQRKTFVDCLTFGAGSYLRLLSAEIIFCTGPMHTFVDHWSRIIYRPDALPIAQPKHWRGKVSK